MIDFLEVATMWFCVTTLALMAAASPFIISWL